MYIGTRGHDFDTKTIEDLAIKCENYSINHIQLALKKSIAGFKSGNFSIEYATKIGEILKEHGVTISVLGCYINPSDTNCDTLKESMNYFIENLYYAKYIGAKIVGLETGFVGEKLDVDKNNTEEAYQHLLKNMKILVKSAEEIGVKIGIEGVHCFVINSPVRMKRLMDDLNSDNACVIFDPTNYLNINNYNEQNRIIDEQAKLLIDKTEILHLKDFKIDNNKLCYEYPCNGMLNIDNITKKILRHKPNIPIILEEVKEDMLIKVVNQVMNRIDISI